MRRELTRQALASADEIADDIRQTWNASTPMPKIAIWPSRCRTTPTGIRASSACNSSSSAKVQPASSPSAERHGDYSPRLDPTRTHRRPYRKATEGDDIQVVTRNVDLKGPWTAVLSMNWSLVRCSR